MCVDSPMKILCPNCATSYDVATAAIGEGGRSVRCVRCRSVWFVDPEQAAPPAVAMAAAPAPAAPAPAAADQLDDLAAWGLEEDPAPGDPPAVGAAPDPAAFDANFSMDSMMADLQATVTLPDGPPLVPVDDWQALDDHFLHSPGVGGAGVAATGGHPGRFAAMRRKRSRRPPSVPTVALALMAVLGAILGWRADVVRVMPQTASLFAAIGLPVNLRGLTFLDVKTNKEVQDGVPVLVVEGRITNITKLMLEVPRLRFAMRNGAGNEVYSWSTLPTQPILAPGAEQSFRTRLASPPAEGREVMVRFFTRRDLVSGMR
jgi:predicted Zn finger-like uncharacterized protein